jgi:hypothetical protein
MSRQPPQLARRRSIRRGLVLLLSMTCASGVVADDAVLEQAATPSSAAADSQPVRELFRGKVVPLADALKRRDIQTAEEMDDHVVLETDAGDLIPILADWRGRAFYQDQRLRDRKVELVGFRREGLPYLQILMVFTFDDEGQRQYTDYWCDICSIPMYEIKPCECCQGETRLRFQERDLPDYLEAPSPADASTSSAPSDE